MNLRERIRQRGNWQVTIRPIDEKIRMDDLGALAALVPRLVVELRGWDFPHVDSRQPISRGLDWVGQESQWAHHIGAFRLHKSGLFVSMTGIPNDWRDESDWWPAGEGWRPMELLGVGDALYSVTEFVEFASRLSTSPLGAEEVELSITLNGAEGRTLYIDSPNRMSFHQVRMSGVNSIPVRRLVERTHLVGDAWGIAAEFSRQIFQVFGWDADLELLTNHQEELRRFGPRQ